MIVVDLITLLAIGFLAGFLYGIFRKKSLIKSIGYGILGALIFVIILPIMLVAAFFMIALLIIVFILIILLFMKAFMFYRL